MPFSRHARPAPADLASALRALADPSRLAILLLLERRPRTVGDVVRRCDLSQPTVSRHLQTLAAAGLVERRREAQRVIYRAHAPNLGALCARLVGAFPRSGVIVKRTAGTARTLTRRKTRKAPAPRPAAARRRRS